MNGTVSLYFDYIGTNFPNNWNHHYVIVTNVGHIGPFIQNADHIPRLYSGRQFYPL
jgi:hypothetical protein